MFVLIKTVTPRLTPQNRCAARICSGLFMSVNLHNSCNRGIKPPEEIVEASFCPCLDWVGPNYTHNWLYSAPLASFALGSVPPPRL